MKNFIRVVAIIRFTYIYVTFYPPASYLMLPNVYFEEGNIEVDGDNLFTKFYGLK